MILNSDIFDRLTLKLGVFSLYRSLLINFNSVNLISTRVSCTKCLPFIEVLNFNYVIFNFKTYSPILLLYSSLVLQLR
mgnify:CR=1 FL=1